MATGKRPIPVSILGQGDNISVEGKITKLSPQMKKSRSTQNEYFDGLLSDNKTSLRLVGFNEQKRARLEYFFNDDTPVVITKCTAETSKANEQLQVIINSSSEITSSATTFKAVVDNNIKLEQLPLLPKYREVTFDAKVTVVHKPTTVGKLQIDMQDVILSNATGCAKMTVWRPFIGTITEGQSYHFVNIGINKFNAKKYLVYGDNSSKQPITAIGEVVMPPTENKQTATNCEVIAVTNLKNTRLCITCKGSVLSIKTAIGKCQKCGAIQKIKACSSRISTRLFLTASTFNRKSFLFYSNHLLQITGKEEDDITEEDILLSSPFNMSWIEDNVISVTR